MGQTRRYFIAIFILMFASLGALADEKGITKHSVKSDIYGTERSFFVKLPSTYEAGKQRVYPVIYLLDGKHYVQHFFNVSDILSEGGLTPEFILVGIEHQQRINELTPTAVTGRSGSGGANKLLQFIEQELMPDIAKRFQTNGFNILAGHSFGGLFTLHALQARPKLFNAHFSFSPSLYWDDKTTVGSVRTLLQSKQQFHNYLYMNMGNEGLEDPYDNSIAMRNGYIELVDFIKQNAPQKFRFDASHMEQEYHMSTAVIGTFYALRSLYRKFPLPTSKIKQGLTAIIKHYDELSAELGFKILPRQGRLYNAGMYHLWANEDLAKGIEILKYNLTLHPKYAWSNDGLAQLYKANGQLVKAQEHCELALQYGDPEAANYSGYKARCDEIQNQLAD